MVYFTPNSILYLRRFGKNALYKSLSYTEIHGIAILFLVYIYYFYEK